MLTNNITNLAKHLEDSVRPIFKWFTIDLLLTFKVAIKQWMPNDCPCRLCRTYIPQVGFV